MTTSAAGCACRSPISRSSAIEEPTRGAFRRHVAVDDAARRAARKSASKASRTKNSSRSRSGTTDASGFFSWTPDKRGGGEVRRIVVNKGLDTLVIDPDSAPSEYAREIWTKPERNGSPGRARPSQPRAEKPRTLCHVFSERPIYRPEEPAHIKGFVRSYRGGALSLDEDGRNARRDGPGNQEWRIPVKLDASGGFYHKFDAQTPATGDYSARFEPDAPKKAKKAEAQKSRTGRSGRGRERSGRARAGHFLRPVHVQEGSLSPADLRGRAQRAADRCARRRPSTSTSWRAISPADLRRSVPSNGAPRNSRMSSRRRGAKAFCSRPTRASPATASSNRRAVLERDQRTDAGGAARMTFDTDDRADRAAAPLLHRSDGDRRRRHRSAQCAERHRAAAFRARREDAALCRAARRGDAGAHRHRRQGRGGRRASR